MAIELPPITEEQEEDLCGGAEFEHLKIFEFSHWVLYLNQNQAHLGRSYVWLKRHVDMMRFEHLLPVERDELFETILPHYSGAVDRLWQPDLVNDAWLGNEVGIHRGHGHLHLVPRYAQPPRMLDFGRVDFSDPCFGQNFSNAPKRIPTDRQLQHIKNQIGRQFR